MTTRTSIFRPLARGFSWTVALVVCVAAIPASSMVALLIFNISPNPRHPPQEMIEEVVGVAIIALFAGLTCMVVSELVTMRERTGFWGEYKGLILGAATGVVVASLLGLALVLVQMDSVSGQAVTSTRLGVSAGLELGGVNGAAGAVAGAVLKRIVNTLMP